MSARVVGVFTGNRAEYGLQLPILRAIDEHPELDYRLIVSGSHLDDDFGGTVSEIKADGFAVHAEVKAEMDEDSLHGTARAIGSGILSMNETLKQLKPEILVVYADRFEGFAAIIAGTQTNTPTAHVEGGDLTEGGALDDSVRHAMSKLAHLHFTTNQQATNRLLAMGEERWRVHTVGYPAIDLIAQRQYASAAEVVARFDLDLERPIIVFTQHSVTTQFAAAERQIAPSLAALGKLAEEGAQVIATYPNNDAGGRRIVKALEDFADGGRRGVQLHRSVGRHFYHGLLALALDPAAAVVCAGNSSSGIKETPAFRCPAVNIGSRQQGRLRAGNVIDADYDAEQIYRAIGGALADGEFRARCRAADNPYGVGEAGRKISDVLATVDLDDRLLRTKMTLRGEERDGWFR